MSEPLPEALRHLVIAETDAPVTSEHAQAAVRARLGTTLGIAGLAAASTATASTAAANTAVGSTAVGGTASALATGTTAGAAAVKGALSIKLLGIVLGVGAAGAVAATVVVTGERSEATQPAIVERAQQPANAPRESQIRVEPIEDVAPQAADEAPIADEAPAPVPARRSPARRADLTAPYSEPPAEPPPTRTQGQLLADATRALSSGDAARALELIEEDARSHTGGPLGEERDALRISALTALGRTTDAREAARRLLATYPDTIHRRLAEKALAKEAP